MKAIHHIILYTLFLIILPSSVYAARYVFQPDSVNGSDTMIKSFDAGSNFGTTPGLNFGNVTTNRIYTLFNFSWIYDTIPAEETITAGTLYLNITGVFADGVSEFDEIICSWGENSVTYTSFGASNINTCVNQSVRVDLSHTITETGNRSVTLDPNWLELDRARPASERKGFILIPTADGDYSILSSSDHTSAAGRPSLHIITSEPDTTLPTYSSFTNNASTLTKINGVVNWSINLSDETALSYYFFAHNNSGTMTNVSNGTLSGTSVFLNKTVTITKPQGNYICGQFWVNDTSNNINQTLLTDSEACFTVVVCKEIIT